MKKFLKTIFILILVLDLGLAPCFANGPVYPLVVNYLFEIAIANYNQGDLKQALHEFKKVLIVEPQHQEALHYIQLIEAQEIFFPKRYVPPPAGIRAKISKEEIMKESLEEMEKRLYPGVSLREAPLRVSPVEIEELPQEIISLPVQKVGEIGLFIDGEEVGLSRPIIFKEGKVFIPLREISRLLSYSLFDLGEQKFRLVSPEGESKEIKVSYLEGEPVITQEELKDYFFAESQFDALEKRFYLKTKRPLGFKTYAVSRPKKEIPKEKIKELPVEEEDTSHQKPTYIPEIARPPVELSGGISYTYTEYHVTPPYKYLSGSLFGHIYDFKISGFQEYKESAGKFDHGTTWLNLEKPGLWMGLFDQGIDLLPLRGQYQSFTGLKIIKGWDSLNKSTFLGGDTENYISGTSGTVKYLGRLVGFQEEFWPKSWLGTKSLILYIENEADIPSLSGTSSYPRRNIINFFDTNLKLTPRLSFLTQLAHCYYSPDNRPDETVSGWDWRIGPELKSQRYNLRFTYEFVGDKYASLGNPSSYQDYKGWDLSGDYKISDRWSISSYFTRYQNNVEEDPTKVTNKSQSFSLSSAHRLFQSQSLNFTFNRTTSNPSGPDPGFSSDSNLYRIDYSTPIFGHYLLLNYQYYRMDSPSPDTLDYYSHTSGGTIFKTFGLGSTWSLHQEFVETFYPINVDKLSSNTSFSFYYRVTPDLDFSFNPSYTWEKSEGAKSTQTVSCSTGLWYKFDPETSLHLDYSVRNHNIKTDEGKWPRDWSIMASLIRNFSFASPARFGRIKGRILKDTNNNTTIDSSDEAVEGIKVKLEDGRIAKTDSQGNFSFLYVIPQKQRLSLDLGDLPLEWTSKDLEKEVSVKAFRTATVKILLVRGSSICGKVFIDENGDSVFQDTEEPVSGITVMLLPGEQIRITDEEGNFRFDSILFGRYQLKINPEDIPVGYKLASEQSKDILLLPGERAKDLNFTIRLKPTSTIQKF